MTEPLSNIEYAKLRDELDHGAPTPDLDTWRRAEAADPNFRWRVAEGHVMNALDQALDRIDELETRLRNHEVLKREAAKSILATDHWQRLAKEYHGHLVCAWNEGWAAGAYGPRGTSNPYQGQTPPNPPEACA